MSQQRALVNYLTSVLITDWKNCQLRLHRLISNMAQQILSGSQTTNNIFYRTPETNTSLQLINDEFSFFLYSFINIFYSSRIWSKLLTIQDHYHAHCSTVFSPIETAVQIFNYCVKIVLFTFLWVSKSRKGKSGRLNPKYHISETKKKVSCCS